MNEENLHGAEALPEENAAAPDGGAAVAKGSAAPLSGKARAWKEIREWVIALASAVLIALLIRTFLFTLIRVDGESMETTLMNNERLFVSVLDVKLSGVERGDVVICHYPNRYSGGLLGIQTETNFVKRVWGVPGDTVERKNGVTYVNGEAIDEMRGIMYPNGKFDDYEPYTLGDDEYFVVGDNVYNSHDSRDWNDRDPSGDVGPIRGNMIVGRARFVIWPLNSVRAIE